MIASLRGTLISKSATEVVIDVNGAGYAVSIPLSTYAKIGELGTTVSILTHLHVREDALQLYGFASEDERNIFRLLISVSGIGPKMAQGILSGISATDLTNYVSEGNHLALTKIPGIGRKIAERLVVELREKITKVEMPSSLPPASSQEQTHVRSETLLALTSLGFSRSTAEKALRAAIQETQGKDVSVETLIKTALRNAGAK